MSGLHSCRKKLLNLKSLAPQKSPDEHCHDFYFSDVRSERQSQAARGRRPLWGKAFPMQLLQPQDQPKRQDADTSRAGPLERRVRVLQAAERRGARRQASPAATAAPSTPRSYFRPPAADYHHNLGNVGGSWWTSTTIKLEQRREGIMEVASTNQFRFSLSAICFQSWH